MIIDYSTARPSVSALKAAGVTAVGRYIGWDSVPGYSSIGKNLTAGEVASLHGAGISAFVSFEYQPDAPSKGAGQGAADGRLATSQVAALGAPPLLRTVVVAALAYFSGRRFGPGFSFLSSGRQITVTAYSPRGAPSKAL